MNGSNTVPRATGSLAMSRQAIRARRVTRMHEGSRAEEAAQLTPAA